MGIGAALICVSFACGKPVIQDVGGTPTPGDDDDDSTPARPSQTTFESQVQPFMDAAAQACNTGGCHDAGTMEAGLLLISNGTGADVQSNYDRLTCYPYMIKYDPPNASLLVNYCLDETTPNPAHNGNAASSQDCQNWYAWVRTGVGDPPNCP